MSNKMINVQEIRRNVINVVKNYSDAQVKVRKATSNEPWGPSSTLMGEIADLTYNVVAFSEIMQIIWKRLNDHGKNWRHVYKALLLLEYLIKTGSEKVAQQCRDNLFAIQTLKDFQYFEDNKDQGLSIREKSKLLVNLLKDEEKLKTERIRALKAKERFAQSLSCMGPSLESSDMPKTSSSYHESLSSHADTFTNRNNLNPELENARPQTAGEEELQLQLALAMSKEEAEQEDRLRKNDDLRLKLALEESEKIKAAEARSAVDDLLTLAAPMPSTSDRVTTDPWGSPLNNRTLALPSPPNKNKPLDPWGAPVPTTTSTTSFEVDKGSTFDDPWSSNPKPAINDPWGSKTNPSTSNLIGNNDPWNLTTNGADTHNSDNHLGDLIAPFKSAGPSAIDSTRRTPESFLGSNSNLVNLDALVSNKNQTSTSPNNPFAPVVVAASSNPFQSTKPSQPSINQLRAQSNPVGGPAAGSSYSNASALSSLFSSPAVAPTPAPLPNGQLNPLPLTTTALAPAASPWANFPSSAVPQTQVGGGAFGTTSPQHNNPFAM